MTDRFDEMAERVVHNAIADILSRGATPDDALRERITETLRAAVAAESERCEKLVRTLIGNMRLPIEVAAELDDLVVDSQNASDATIRSAAMNRRRGE